MSARRVRQLLAATAVTGVVALVPASAGAHPEACAVTGAMSSAPSADWFANWTAESEGCMSTTAVQGFDDSGASSRAGESTGRDNLDAALEHAEAGAVRGRGRLQLRPRVRERLRVRRQLRRRPDLGRPQRPDAGAGVVHPAAPARRTTSRSTTASSSPRPTRSATRPSATATCRCRRQPGVRPADELGGPARLRRPQPVPAEVPDVGAHGLRLAHPHRAARARPAADLRPVVRHPSAGQAQVQLRAARPDLDRLDPEEATRPRRRSSPSRCCSRTAATTARPARCAPRPAATTSPSTRRSAWRPARARARA